MRQENEAVNDMKSDNWTGQLDTLAEEVKMLALNLAINLARSKHEIAELSYLEPEFTKLINGSVEVIREITTMMRAFRNEEKMVYTPTRDSSHPDKIEASLNEILEKSQDIIEAIALMKKRKSQIGSYKKG